MMRVSQRDLYAMPLAAEGPRLTTLAAGAAGKMAANVFTVIDTAVQDAADWIINRVVESGVAHLDRAFPEYHQGTISPYDCMRSKIFETDRYPNRDALFEDLLKQIREGRIT